MLGVDLAQLPLILGKLLFRLCSGKPEMVTDTVQPMCMSVPDK